MSDLIIRLIDEIDYAESAGKSIIDMDAISFPYKEGVIISHNEAKIIVKAFEALKEVVTISDRKHNARDKAKEALNAVGFNKLPLSYGEVMRSNPEIPSSDYSAEEELLKRKYWKLGYNQAKSETGFSLEDIENAYNSGNGYGSPDDIKDFHSFIQSLKQKNLKMNWKEASKMPDKGYGWFAVATLPRNHSGSDEKDSTDLSGDNEWRKSFGFTTAWLHNGEWYEADPTGSRRMVNIARFVTHWDDLPEVPTLTEPFKYSGSARYSERQDKEVMQDLAMKTWEEDQETNPTPVNPHAYSYGFMAALRLIGLR